MKPRLAFLSGLLAGSVITATFFGWYGTILLGDVRDELHGLDASISKVTGAFDLAFDEKIPSGRPVKKPKERNIVARTTSDLGVWNNRR